MAAFSGTKHVIVDHQCLLIAEQAGEVTWAVFGLETIVTGNRTSRWQRPAHRRHPLDLATELELLGEQRLSRRPVLDALVGDANGTFAGELIGGDRGRGFGVHGRSPEVSVSKTIISASEPQQSPARPQPFVTGYHLIVCHRQASGRIEYLVSPMDK